MNRPSLTRRRGIRRDRQGRTVILIGLVGLLVLIALVLGIVVGTQLSSDYTSDTTGQSRLAGRLRGAAEAGVHQLMQSKTIKELDEMVRSHNKDQSLKHLHDDEAKHSGDNNEEAAKKKGEDDDKMQENELDWEEEFDGEGNGGDLPPSEKPKANVDASKASSVRPYPYSLDPVPVTIDFSSWTAPGGKRFTEYTNGDSPYTITPELKQKSDIQARSRREHVRNAMKFAWGSYVKYAFGADELLPQTHSASDSWGKMGTTLVDSLDTLWLMGLKDEFWKARDWVRDKLTHTPARPVSLFETTIRSLGGLLSAYDWSHDVAFLDKAKDLGAKLFHAFDQHELPNGEINLVNGENHPIGWAGSNAILSEVGTLQLEFRYLAKMTNKTEYATKTEHVFEILDEISPPNGLLPYFLRNGGAKPSFANDKLTFGAMSDSYYEYMLKIWLQGGKTEPLYRKMYDRSVEGMHKELLQTSSPSGLVYIADKNSGRLDYKMDHLVCFMGGLLALGAYTDPLGFESERAQRDFRTAKALTYTCYQMYARMNTGISPEFIQFDENDFHPGNGAPHYLLRPEAFESFYILNHLTGDPIYREWGWECFSAIERYCKTDFAYGGLRDVENINVRPDNKMESFFLAETLKYLFLLQDPDSEIDLLNKHVFNTEAHPMRIFPVIDKESK